MARIDAAQQQYQAQKEKYERLRSDVTIKLKFLEENKVGVPRPERLTACPGQNTQFLLSPFCSPGEGDAQAAPPLPQRHFSLLCWQPAAVGADAEAVQHKVETPGGRQALLVRGAVRRSSGPPTLTSTLPAITPYLLYEDHDRRKHMQITVQMTRRDAWKAGMDRWRAWRYQWRQQQHKWPDPWTVWGLSVPLLNLLFQSLCFIPP